MKKLNKLNVHLYKINLRLCERQLFISLREFHFLVDMLFPHQFYLSYSGFCFVSIFDSAYSHTVYFDIPHIIILRANPLFSKDRGIQGVSFSLPCLYSNTIV